MKLVAKTTEYRVREPLKKACVHDGIFFWRFFPASYNWTLKGTCRAAQPPTFYPEAYVTSAESDLEVPTP